MPAPAARPWWIALSKLGLTIEKYVEVLHHRIAAQAPVAESSRSRSRLTRTRRVAGGLSTSIRSWDQLWQ
jgi:hypothetical protein